MIFPCSLNGKVGLLTGGTSGFGYEMVKALLSYDSSVAVFSVDDISDEQIEELNKMRTGEVEFFHMDITGKSAAAEMVQITEDRFSKLDFVIANAGFALRFEEP